MTVQERRELVITIVLLALSLASAVVYIDAIIVARQLNIEIFGYHLCCPWFLEYDYDCFLFATIVGTLKMLLAAYVYQRLNTNISSQKMVRFFDRYVVKREGERWYWRLPRTGMRKVYFLIFPHPIDNGRVPPLRDAHTHRGLFLIGFLPIPGIRAPAFVWCNYYRVYSGFIALAIGNVLRFWVMIYTPIFTYLFDFLRSIF